ncbi:hypothetical protein B0A48_07114 [Cryoendolithus antarcticus]|uniref:Uncharacterized protein n=1 Tax=Cryoendolithus antarcticus TaxID=1507870 RepID=A0A1V8T7M7_9PEZI|nr:hypothetical protein B0A48_07114 [Cryoendolithus antarcticus]
MNIDSEKTKVNKEEPDTLVSLIKLSAYILLQAGALAAGVFTILAWINSQDAKTQADAANDLSQDANSKANAANVLAFAALCGNSPSQPYISSLCEVVSPSANVYLSSMASSMFSVSITADPRATMTSSASISTSSSASFSQSGNSSAHATRTSATPGSVPTGLATNGAGGGAGGPQALHLTTSTKIAIGAGVGIGLPTLMIAVAGLWLIRRKRL